MRTWRIAILPLRCGAQPDCEIAVGQPYLELAGATWRKVRCAAHAGEPVPDHIAPDAISPPVVTSPQVPTFRHIRTLAHDWKQQQAGEA